MLLNCRNLFLSSKKNYEKKNDPDILDVKSVLLDPEEKAKLEKLKHSIEVPALVSILYLSYIFSKT